MFNDMTTSDVLLAVGRVLREAAAVEGAPDEYHRSQLLSAYSVVRHLAAEQAVAAELLSGFRDELASVLDDEPERAAAVRGASDTARMGEVVDDLLTDPAAAEHRARVQALLRTLADREVAALADPPREART